MGKSYNKQRDAVSFCSIFLTHEWLCKVLKYPKAQSINKIQTKLLVMWKHDTSLVQMSQTGHTC